MKVHMSEGTWKAFVVPSAVCVLAQPVDRYAAGVWIECLAAGSCLVTALRVMARPLLQYTEHVLAGSLVGFLVLGQAAVSTVWGYSWPSFYAWLLNSALCFWFLVSNETDWEDWTRTHLVRTRTGQGRDDMSWTDGQDTRTPPDIEPDSVRDAWTDSQDIVPDAPDIGGTAVRTRPSTRTRAGTRLDTVSRSEAATVRTARRMAEPGPYAVSDEPVSESWWQQLP